MNVAVSSVAILTLLAVIITIVYFTLFDAVLDSRIITTSTRNGLLRGRVLNTLIDKRNFFAYRGIPYAFPPVYSLRFRVNLLAFDYLLSCNSKKFNCVSFSKRPRRNQDRGMACWMQPNTEAAAVKIIGSTAATTIVCTWTCLRRVSSTAFVFVERFNIWQFLFAQIWHQRINCPLLYTFTAAHTMEAVQNGPAPNSCSTRMSFWWACNIDSVPGASSPWIIRNTRATWAWRISKWRSNGSTITSIPLVGIARR